MPTSGFIVLMPINDVSPYFLPFFIAGWGYKQDNQKIQGDRTGKEVA